MQNLFSYPLLVEELTSATKSFHLKATQPQLAYIAEVLKTVSAKSFSADIQVQYLKKEHLIEVWGNVSAELELTSVVSLENFNKKYQSEFRVEFDTKATIKNNPEEEIDLEADLPDPVIDGKIDLAEIAMEQIALIIDDFPRQDGEEFHFQSEFDEETTQAMNPFNVLAKLKK